MTTVQRPNKDALIKVMDIYRDAMRPFLVHHLRQVPGKRVEDAIRQALRDNQANQFDQNLQNGRSVEESIDINDFPELVRVLLAGRIPEQIPRRPHRPEQALRNKGHQGRGFSPRGQRPG